MDLAKFFDFLEDEKNIYCDWEKSNSFKSVKNKESYYIPLDKERIVKVNNDLRLKRKNPISNKNTLENCMKLKLV